MSEPLITIGRFTNLWQADLARDLLEANGIPAFLSDENLISLGTAYGALAGGARLQVRESDAERAVALLEELENDPEP